MRLIAILFLLVAVAGVMAACSGSKSVVATVPAGVVVGSPVANPTATPAPVITSADSPGGKVMEIQMNLAWNGSPQQGTAVFTRITGDVTKVAIRLRPGVRSQSAAIQRGDCSAPTGYKASLRNVIGGVVTQELRDLPFDDLLKGGLTLVINANNDTRQVIAACAEFPKVE